MNVLTSKHVEVIFRWVRVFPVYTYFKPHAVSPGMRFSSELLYVEARICTRSLHRSIRHLVTRCQNFPLSKSRLLLLLLFLPLLPFGEAVDVASREGTNADGRTKEGDVRSGVGAAAGRRPAGRRATGRSAQSRPERSAVGFVLGGAVAAQSRALSDSRQGRNGRFGR